MDLGFVILVFLVAGGVLVGLPLASLVILSRLRHAQDETTARLSRQLREVQDALADERLLLSRLLESPGPAEAKAPPETAPPVPRAAGYFEEARPPAAPASSAPEIPIRPVAPKAVPAAPLFDDETTVEEDEGIPGEPYWAKTAGPAASPRAPREPNRFEAAAKDVLRKIWNWIIVGEEHIPEGVSVEFAVASQWLLRIGMLLLVVGVGFFLKYSIEHDLITPVGRVGLAAVGGLALLVGGTRILGGKYHVLGQGLMGGGIATLYFSVFAASALYHLIPSMEITFAGMIAITALAGFIAVRFQSLLVAVLGIIGGYGTPVMLATGEANFLGLYGYMLVLGIGVLGICSRKRWPLLNYLSLLCNYGLVISSINRYYDSSHFWEVMPFLTAFFVLFSTMVFVYNLAKRTKSNLLDALVLFLNAGAFFVLSYRVIEPVFGYRWVAAVTLSLTAFYAAHVYYCLARRLLDRELMLSFTGLAAFFLTITVPLLLSREWITVSWAVQALVLLWIAGKLNSQFLRHVSYALYLLVLYRFAFLDLSGQFGAAAAVELPLSDYLWQMLERIVMFGVPIASLGLAFPLLKRQRAADGWAVDRGEDIGEWVREQWALKAILMFALGMLFLYLHLELNRTFGFLLPPARLPGLTLLWLAMCVYLLLQYRGTENVVMLGLLVLFVGGLITKLFLFDLPAWSLGESLWYEGPYRFTDAGFRLLDFGTSIAFFAGAFMLLRGGVAPKKAGTVLGSMGLSLLFVYTTLEVNSFLHHFVEGMRAGGVSILWSLFALLLVLFGIRKSTAPLRYIGLALFAIVAGKVFWFDLARLDQIYRVVAFFLLGFLLLCGSFVYLKYRQDFTSEVKPREEAEP